MTLLIELSREALKRLQWFDDYVAHSNAALTCRYFGISHQTFYRWKRRYDPQTLRILEDGSRRPLRRRRRLPGSGLTGGWPAFLAKEEQPAGV